MERPYRRRRWFGSSARCRDPREARNRTRFTRMTTGPGKWHIVPANDHGTLGVTRATIRPRRHWSFNIPNSPHEQNAQGEPPKRIIRPSFSTVQIQNGENSADELKIRRRSPILSRLRPVSAAGLPPRGVRASGSLFVTGQ